MRHPAIVLKNLNASARKSLGQNFLIHTKASEQYLNYFFSDAEWEKSLFLEIGPGLGAVTELILKRTNNLFLCEYDKIFVPFLKSEFNIKENQIVQNDFLNLPASFWKEKSITNVIGNLPYYITSPILIKIIKEMPFIKKIFVGVQWEYAQKLKEKKMTSLTALLKTMGEIHFVKKISRNSFYPIPKVDASWIAWERDSKINETLINEYEIFLRGLFWAKRKTLLNSLLNNPHFEEYPFSVDWKNQSQKILKEKKWDKQRAESLKIDQIIEIFHSIRSSH